MPLIEDKQQQVGFARSIGQPDFDPETQSFSELASAAFRTENTLGSLIARNSGLPDDVINNESFNPWDHITEDEKLNENFTSHITLADTVEEIEAVRKQSAREQKDRQALAEGGANSFFAQMAVGVMDPINFIPVGGTAYKTYKTGSSILKSAAVTAGVASGTQAAVEMGLHHTQLERTFGESALNVGTAALLGGIIGAAPPVIKEFFKKDINAQVLDSMDPEPKVSSGGNSIFTAQQNKSVGAAAVDRDIQVQGKIARAMTKALGFDPLSRSLTSQEPLTRNLAVELAENPIAMENKSGTFTAASVETAAKIKDGRYYEAVEGHLSAFKEYRKTGGPLKQREFNELVSKEMRNPSSRDPHIVKSAEVWRSKLYDPLKKEMIDNELLPKDVDVTTAVSYLNRVWNKDKIRTNLDSFVNITSTWLKEKQTLGVEAKKGIELLSTKFESQELNISKITKKIKTSETQLSKAEKQLEEVLRTEKQNVERLFSIKDKKQRKEISVSQTKIKERSKILNDRVSGLNAQIKTLSDQLTVSGKGQLKTFKELEGKVIDFPSKIGRGVKPSEKAKISKELASAIRSVKGFDDIEQNFDPLAREIATRITSTPDGRLPYDYQIGENSSKQAGKQGLPGVTKARSFTIPDELIENFLENDIEKLGGRYLQSLAVDIELVKRFGDVNMTKEIKEISEAWDIKIQEASKTDKKQARKLAKQKDTDIESIAAMRDRMRGVFGQVDSDGFWVRARRTARDLNYLRFMGGVTASSIPDVARIVMSNGIVSTFKNGLSPLINNTKAFRISADEAKKYGVGTDILIGGRSELIADVADYSQGGTAFERGIRSAAQKFGKVNLMDRWTASVKQLHAVVAQTDMANIMVAGKFDKRLAQLGINEPISRDIAKQLRKFGKKDGGVWIANTRLWDDQGLAEIWGGALRKESDRVIVVPGQEKPLFMSTDMGKTFLQFRSFMFSATQRMLIAGIQGQDAHFMQGFVGITSLGMMAYAFKQWDAGRDLSDDPAVWVTEGIDRSGATGIIMEMNNTIEKVSNNNFGLRPLLGISTPSSRFASRSQAEAFLGPTFGSMLSTVLKVSGGTADGDLAESDIRAIRRLLPYQNLMIFRQLIDKVESELQ